MRERFKQRIGRDLTQYEIDWIDSLDASGSCMLIGLVFDAYGQGMDDAIESVFKKLNTKGTK